MSRTPPLTGASHDRAGWTVACGGCAAWDAPLWPPGVVLPALFGAGKLPVNDNHQAPPRGWC